MNESNEIQNGLAGKQDDLQQIKGIGQSIAESLQELGIHTCSDLAAFTPDSLAELLKDRLPSISARRIKQQDWLGQARALARLRHQPEAVPAEDEAAPAPAVEHNSSPANDWREVADFFVSFGFAPDRQGQERLITKVHHSQADQSEQWEGVASDELLNWMLERANLPHSEAQPAAFQPASEETAVLALSDLWISEVREPVLVDGEPVPGLLCADTRLSITGPAAEPLTREQLAFEVELFLVDAQTGDAQLAAAYPGQLVPGELTYNIQQEFSTPTDGRYQVYVMARLLPPGTATGYLQGPYIRVEP